MRDGEGGEVSVAGSDGSTSADEVDVAAGGASTGVSSSSGSSSSSTGGSSIIVGSSTVGVVSTSFRSSSGGGVSNWAGVRGGEGERGLIMREEEGSDGWAGGGDVGSTARELVLRELCSSR